MDRHREEAELHGYSSLATLGDYSGNKPGLTPPSSASCLPPR
jgi:hypothetical protein